MPLANLPLAFMALVNLTTSDLPLWKVTPDTPPDHIPRARDARAPSESPEHSLLAHTQLHPSDRHTQQLLHTQPHSTRLGVLLAAGPPTGLLVGRVTWEPAFMMSGATPLTSLPCIHGAGQRHDMWVARPVVLTVVLHARGMRDQYHIDRCCATARQEADASQLVHVIMHRYMTNSVKALVKDTSTCKSTNNIIDTEVMNHSETNNEQMIRMRQLVLTSYRITRVPTQGPGRSRRIGSITQPSETSKQSLALRGQMIRHAADRREGDCQRHSHRLHKHDMIAFCRGMYLYRYRTNSNKAPAIS